MKFLKLKTIFYKLLTNFLQIYHELSYKVVTLFYELMTTSYKNIMFLQTSYKLLLASFKIHRNFLHISSCKLLMNFLQTSYKLLTNFLQTSYKLLTNFLQTSYKLHTNFCQLLTKSIKTFYIFLLTNFLQTSYKLLMNFLQTSYEFLTNV